MLFRKRSSTFVHIWCRPGCRIAWLLPAVCLTGCGERLESSVTGVVTYQGAPLEKGNVAFYPVSGAPALATIGKDGTYRLRTASKSGLAAGEYRAIVTSFEVIPGDPPMPGESLIPRRYSRPDTSNLQFSVQPGANTIEIELE